MLINYVPGEECRIAVVEDGRLEEFHTERAGAVSFVGNIYVGRVTNVEPSIQAAFIDFGLESNGFLHVSDVHPMYFPGGDDKTEMIGKKTPRRERPPIQACLRKGQEIVVQVLKEGINTKGPTLTSYISIPGRYLVMLPDMDRVGVSRKVEDDSLRREMRKVLDALELPEGFGFILRTAGEGRGKLELKRDLAYLTRLWKDIERRRKTGDRPRLLYAESDLLMRALRDFWTSDINEIVIDSESALNRAARFMKIVAPRSSTRLLHYDRTTPLFHAFGIEEQILRTHAREVPLPSGGSLVIDETEAMIAIDVNSGKSRSHGDAETTAFRTNVEAVDEICRQLRLRDVGGLVLCDLIDMMSRSHRRDIEAQFKERLKRDRAASKTLPISQFGIVEMTRQRQKQSLRNTHYAKCPECSGRGVLKRPDSVADDAMRDLAALLEHQKVSKVELVVSPRVAGELLSHKRQTLGRLEYTLKKHVDVRVSEDIPGDRIVFYAYDDAGADVDIERLPRPKPPTDLPDWTIVTPKTDADWAVDTAQETPGQPPELAAPDAAVDTDSDELLLADDFDDSDDIDAPATAAARAGAGADSAQPANGKRRRRRRRRGGKGERAGAPDDGSAAPANRDERAAQPARVQPAAQRPVDGAESEGSMTPAAKRRRRRRRKGSIDRAQGAPGAPGTPGTPGPEQPIGAPGSDDFQRSAEPREDTGSSRGDSWDLPASAVRPLPAPAAPAPAVNGVAHGAPASDEGPAPTGGRKKKRRRRGGGSRAADDSPRPAPAEAPSEPPTPTAAPDEPGEGPVDGGAKPSRRRRKKRGKAGDKAAAGEAPSTPAAPKASPAGAAPASTGPKLVPPKRALYVARRKLKPSEAASARPRDE